MRKYQVEHNEKTGSFIIIDTKTGKHQVFGAGNFIMNTKNYNEKTEKLPNYIHKEVWKLHRIAQQKILKSMYKNGEQKQ